MARHLAALRAERVSVLFSEPKISQVSLAHKFLFVNGFVSVLFSEPKISQPLRTLVAVAARGSFSALQRAENFSTGLTGARSTAPESFSALQRAENFSTGCASTPSAGTNVSVLFSEPKISQCLAAVTIRVLICVSVLFSEPKISQPGSVGRIVVQRPSFQCSSASRKFLNRAGAANDYAARAFQCSSASRKFLNPTLAPASIHIPDRDDHASSFLSLPGVSL